jgi:hypothetical protein
LANLGGSRATFRRLQEQHCKSSFVDAPCCLFWGLPFAAPLLRQLADRHYGPSGRANRKKSLVLLRRQSGGTRGIPESTHTGLPHQTRGVTRFLHGMHISFRHDNQKELAAMKCLRIYATPDGESHFDEVELPTTKRSVHPDAAPFDVSASYQASRVRVTRIPAGMREVAWHTVPEPNLAVRLDGSVEYETSDGEVRHVQAGSFVLVEDTHGKGHLSRHSAEAQTVIWISLPNGLDLPPA